MSTDVRGGLYFGCEISDLFDRKTDEIVVTRYTRRGKPVQKTYIDEFLVSKYDIPGLNVKVGDRFIDELSRGYDYELDYDDDEDSEDDGYRQLFSLCWIADNDLSLSLHVKGGMIFMVLLDTEYYDVQDAILMPTTVDEVTKKISDIQKYWNDNMIVPGKLLYGFACSF